MREYDLICLGTGSALAIVDVMVRDKPQLKVAVVDKDEPGGICLTRGCIPSKLLLYPAELVRTLEDAKEFGVDADLKKIRFEAVMKRMRTIVGNEINMISRGLKSSKNIDYYRMAAEFVAPYTLKVGNETIRSNMIFLCIGSKPAVPPVDGLDRINYITSDTLLNITRLPRNIVLIGGGYVAAEYGHFLSAMGSKVTIIGRNPRFIPEEEPEVSALAKKELQKHMMILTNHEARRAEAASGMKRITAVNNENGKEVTVVADEILVASGRAPNTDILHPERAGIATSKDGWIIVDEYLQTSQPNVWALGDADGNYPFKHVANYEARIVYYNAVLKEKVKVDYHAVPHAVFTVPEIASVGLREKDAIEQLGKDKVLIGIHRYQDTAKGEAMNVKDCFVKVIVEAASLKILGAHVIGPYASVLIQEIIDLMYTAEQSAKPLMSAMHIHPALSEVVQGAFGSLMVPEQYHHVIEHHYGLSL